MAYARSATRRADKGKSILAFCGRKHHFERLIPVVNGLRANGHKVRWIASGNSVLNNDLAVEYLIPVGEEFVHTDDYLLSDDIPSVTKATHHFMKEIGEKTAPDVDFATYIEPWWIAASTREAIELTFAYRRLLEKEKPDCVLILHANNFFTRLLAHLCQEKAIPVVAFQEGHLRKRDEKTQGKQSMAADDCTKLLTWSEGAKSEYVKTGIPESKLAVVGIPHLDDWFKLINTTPADKITQAKAHQKWELGYRPNARLACLALPLISRFDGNGMKHLGLIADWSASTGTQVAFRFHPFESKAIVEKIKSAVAEHPYTKVVETGETLALVLASDLILSQHTTIAVEALALGVPLAEIDLENVGVLESLAEQEVAIKIGRGELGKVKQILDGKLKVDSVKLHNWLEYNIGQRDGESASRAVSEIERLM